MNPQNSQPITPPVASATPVSPSTPSSPTADSSGVGPEFSSDGGRMDSSEVNNAPQKSSPLITIAIVLLGVAVLALVAYFVGTKYLGSQKPVAAPTATASLTPSATPDPTANWKIFDGGKNKIKFKYPETWYAKQMFGWTFSVFLENRPFEIPEASELITSIQVSFNEIQNTTTNQKYFSEKTIEEALERINKNFDPSSIKTVNLKVDGREAVQTSGVAGPGMLQDEFFKITLIQMDGKVLEATLYKKDQEDIYDQILSTFKFIQ